LNQPSFLGLLSMERRYYSPQFWSEKYMGNFVALIASGVCSALASILLRVAGTHNVTWLPFGSIGLRIVAIGAYGVGFVLYAIALRKVPLTIAYPLMVAVTFIGVAAFSVAVEHIFTGRQMIGAAAVFIGILFLVWK
jgi:drug/metabolite transporter (DMT)-like permease